MSIPQPLEANKTLVAQVWWGKILEVHHHASEKGKLQLSCKSNTSTKRRRSSCILAHVLEIHIGPCTPALEETAQHHHASGEGRIR